MITIPVLTTDEIIWNKDDVIICLGKAMSDNNSIQLDLKNEGPCFESLGLPEIIHRMKKIYHYDKKISVLTKNLSQSQIYGFDFDVSAPTHLLNSVKTNLSEKNIIKDPTKKFGLFIGRANAARLELASYCWKTSKQDFLMTYLFDIKLEYHRENIGFESLMKKKSQLDVLAISEFLSRTPIKQQEKTLSDKFPERAIEAQTGLKEFYKDFIIEIVCETFYTGNTFFPTEKIWRPIILRTPFIVQGPRHFLHRLRDLGFKTFDNWWDEGYAEDPPDWQIEEIKKVLDRIVSLDLNVVSQWYKEMTPILEHNQKRLLELTDRDLKSLYKISI